MRPPKDLATHLLAGALLAVLLALLIWPILSVVRAGFVDMEGYTLHYFRSIFEREDFKRAFVNSFLVAVGVVSFTAAMSLPMAWLMTNFDFPLKRLLGSLILVPLILPPFVGAIGLRRLLAPIDGPIVLIGRHLGLIAEGAAPDLLRASPLAATVLLISLNLNPIMFLNCQAALANIDPAMEEAATNLGAGRWRTFLRVTIPLMMPGLFAGATIVFIWSFTELGTPLMVGFRDVVAVKVFDGLSALEVNPQPYALVVLMLLASILAYVVGKLILGRGGAAMIGKATLGRQTHRLRPARGWLVTAFFVGIAALSLLPHMGVMLLALADRWQVSILPQEFTLNYMGQVLTHELTGPSITNSLKYASLSTLLDLVLGVAIGYVIVRSRVRWRGVLDSLSMLPLAVPGLVMAFGYLAVTGRGSPLAFLSPDRGDPTALLVIAYGIRRLPYIVRSVVAGLQQTSESLEEAAINLGAGRLRTVWSVTLPLIMANLIGGAILAFSFAMLEVSDSLILAFQEEHYPITKAIYSLGLRIGDGNEMACALGVLGMILLVATLVGASRLLGKRLGALFRV